MTTLTDNVLKSKCVKLAGVHRIGKDVPVIPVEPDGRAHARARVVSQGPGLSIVEVTCPCGEVIQLRCVYPSIPNQAVITEAKGDSK